MTIVLPAKKSVRFPADSGHFADLYAWVQYVTTAANAGSVTAGVAPIKCARAVTTTNMASFTAVSTTLDGLTLVEGNRVLVAAQSTPAENGIYVVGTVADGAANWTRAADMAAVSVVPNGTIIVIDAGTLGANRIYKLTNAGTITVASTGMTFQRLYTSTELAVYDAATAGATLIGIRDNGSKFTATTVDGALTEAKTLIDANTAAIFAKKTVAVTHGDLSGASTVINIGTALPANAVVVAHEYVITEQFAGEADTTLKIGGTDDDAIVTSFDLDATGTGSYQGTLGVHPKGSFSEQQLVATFAATALGDLSAGEMTITVWYHVLA